MNEDLARQLLRVLDAGPRVDRGPDRPGDWIRPLLAPGGEARGLAPTAADPDAGPAASSLIRSVTAAPEASQGLLEEMARLGRQISGLSSATLQSAESIEHNTRATVENTTTRGRENPSLLEQAARGVAGRQVANFTLSPLLNGILRLFGRKREEPEPALTPWLAPPQQRLDYTTSAAGLTPSSYGPGGLPRVPAGQTQNVQIQVHAMDSRSFLDHSDEIARAVRQAMLNAHSINDTVGEL